MKSYNIKTIIDTNSKKQRNQPIIEQMASDSTSTLIGSTWQEPDHHDPNIQMQLTICKQYATLNTKQSQHTHIPKSRTPITRFKQNDRQTYQSTWYTTVTMTTPIYDDAKDYVIQHGYAVNCIDDQQRKGSRRCYDFISTPIVDAGDDHIQDDQHSKKRPALISVIMMEPVSSNNEANQHNITANHYHN